jgi:galactokinase
MPAPAAERATALFQSHFGRPPLVTASAPARVNIIGEHVDYAGGLCLPAAVDLRLAVAAGTDPGSPGAAAWLRGPGRRWTETAPPPEPAAGAEPELELELVSEEMGTHHAGLPPQPTGEWPDVVLGVVDQLLGDPVAGRPALLPAALHLAIASDIPTGAGLSSSAATGVAVALALLALAGRELQPIAVAHLCRRAENDFLGVPSGLMDQVGCLLGQPGHALLFDAAHETVEPVKLPPELRLLVIDSGIHRRLAETPYETRVRETVALLARVPTSPTGAWRLEPQEAAALHLPAPLDRRARHIATEVARVRAAVARIAASDLEGLGRLLLESHYSLRDDFEVSLPEIDALVHLAISSGCLGARIMGAGFGGSVLGLVRADHAEIARHLLLAAGPEVGRVWLLDPSEGARLSLPWP